MINTEATILEVNVQDEVKVKPDTVIVTIQAGNSGKVYESYESASKNGIGIVNGITNLIDFMGFNVKNEVKLGSKSIRPEYQYSNVSKEHIEKSKGNIKETETKHVRTLLGYSFSQRIVLKTSSDNTSIAKLYCKLLDNSDIESVDVTYTAENVEDYKDILVSNLIKKAKRKAEVIAKAADLKVLQIKEIKQVDKYSSVAFMNSCSMNEYNFRCSTEDDVENILNLKSNEDNILKDELQVTFYIG